MTPGKRDGPTRDEAIPEIAVLVVEDDPGLLPVLSGVVADFGFEVATAADGAEAWEILRRQRYPIVLTDWMMPGMDGVELIRAIRARLGTDYTWVILLTAHSDETAFREGMAAGADDFLAKPWRAEELEARLEVARRHMQLQQQLAETNRTLRRSNRELEVFHHRVSRELEAAARVQRAMLPSDLSFVEGLSVAWDLRPCEELAGDILNVVSLDETRLGLYVLDVSGHGVSAALLSAQLGRLLSPDPNQSQLLCQGRGNRRRVVPPVDVLRELNELFPMDPLRPQFFTLVYGVLDAATGDFEYSAAGHPGPFVIRAEGDIEDHTLPGTPVGMIRDGRWQRGRLRLQPGDHLALVSDGLIEAEKPSGEVFGVDRLRSAMARLNGCGPDEGCRMVVEAVEEWVRPGRLRDDCSVLLVSRETAVSA